MRNPKNAFASAELQFNYRLSKHLIRLNGTADTARYFNMIWDQDLMNLQEQFYVIYLNSAGDVLAWRCLNTGTANRTMIDVKLLFACALGCMATAVLVAHNHPSGYVQPSDVDRKLTASLKEGCRLLGLTFLDHLIIGIGKYFSFKEHESLHQMLM